MVERETHIILPKKDKVRILPLCNLRIEINGIDRISTPTTSTGLRYEDYCFNQLLTQFPEDFVIGPRLIDYMGDVCHTSLFNSKGRTRPDALVLRDELDSKSAIIVAIAEFKSGNDPEIKPKARGFQDLAKALEENPEELFKGLQLSIGEVVDILPLRPQNVHVLGEKLRVIFMTNYEIDELKKEDYPVLDFDYLTLPFFPVRVSS